MAGWINRLGEKWRKLPLLYKLLWIIVLGGSLGLSAILPEWTLTFEPSTPDVGSIQSVNLWVDGFLLQYDEWTEVGASPWLDSQDQPNNYFYADASSLRQYNFTFQNLPSDAIGIVNVTLYLYFDTGLENSLLYFDTFVWNGTDWSYGIDCFQGGWGWKSYVLDSTYNIMFSSVGSVNDAQIRFMSGTYASSYRQQIDAAYLKVYYQTAEPPSVGYYWGVQKNDSHAEITVNWLADSSRNISGYIFNWKGQNESWVSLGGDSNNETVTIFKSVTGESSGWLYWQMWVNDTAGEWSTTGNKSLWIWKEQKQFVSEELASLGEMGSWTRGFYYNGSKEAIYVVYMNTSTTPWSYYCRVYDMANDNWTVGYYIADAPEDDVHYAPSMGMLPDGRLLITYGYYTNFKVRTSVYSADTESNLTKLITNWNAEQTVYSSSTSCYPFHASLENTSLVLFRDGGAQGGNAAVLRWQNNVNVTLWVNEWDASYDEWEDKVGSSPYLDDSDDRVATFYVDKTIGDFDFEDIPFIEQKDAVELYIQCSSTSTAPIEVYLYNGTGIYSLGISEWYGWKKWDVSQYFSTTSSLNIAEIRLTSRTVNESYRYVYRAYLKVVNTTGFTEKITIASHTSNLNSPRNHELYVFNNTVVASWKIKESAAERETKVCLTYSIDEGQTWRFYNGTVVNGSPSMGNFTIYDFPISDYGYKTVTQSLILQENNQFTILAHYYNANYTYGRDHEWYGFIINGTLGSAEIDVYNATYYNGTRIFFPPANNRIYVDAYYNRPAFWVAFNNLTGFAKFVQYPEKPCWFRKIYEITNYNSEVVSRPLVNPQEAYENIVERRKPILGNYSIYNTKEDATNDTLYGVKFTASTSGYLTKFWLYVDFSDPTGSFSIKFGIYNSTLHLIGNGSKTMVTTPDKRWYRFGFSPSIYVYQEQTYWIAFKIVKNNYYDIYYKETSDQQASFTYTTTWTDPLPDSISSPTYQNRTYSAFGVEVIIEIVGTASFTPLYTGWNNFAAWSVDVGHTLADVNASLWLDNINWTVIEIEYANGTRVSLVYDDGEYIGVEMAAVNSTDDEFWIYCLEAGEWYHTYP